MFLLADFNLEMILKIFFSNLSYINIKFCLKKTYLEVLYHSQGLINYQKDGNHQ